MLEAILQVRPSNEQQVIEEDDRRIINKCMILNVMYIYILLIYFFLVIDSIRHRITVLRKKVELSEP